MNGINTKKTSALLFAVIGSISITRHSHGFTFCSTRNSMRKIGYNRKWHEWRVSIELEDVEGEELKVLEWNKDNKEPVAFNDYEDEWLEDDVDGRSGDIVSSQEEIKYTRDEDDILTELEDRLYSTEAGALKVESCILVGVEDLSKGRGKANDEWFSLEESMMEMRELIKTAGMEIAGEVTQRLNEPNPKTYIGSGKVKEVDELAISSECNTIVFDAEITPRQQKALENAFNKNITLQDDFSQTNKQIKVIDRTALILDIFAQHAKTREGKLQVDLALHQYRKPRLTRMWTHLERQSGAGGVGLRGPGELQLEIDKRLLRDRILVLEKKLDQVRKQRGLHRKKRKGHRNAIPLLSLVGYTNAGKSTLLNFLTRAGVMAQNILFATLDPTTRRVKLPGYKTHPEVLITDTVGFIQKLPTNLVAAFRATLEEVQDADVLLHMIDVSNPAWRKQEIAVRTVLKDMECEEKPIIRIFNKIDCLDEEDADLLRLEAASSMKNAVAISAVTGEGMEDLVALIEDVLSDFLVPIELELPFHKGDELHLIHEVGNVDTIEYRETGTYVYARIPKSLANRLKPYQVHELHQEDSSLWTEPSSIHRNNQKDDDDDDWVTLARGRHISKKE